MSVTDLPTSAEINSDFSTLEMLIVATISGFLRSNGVNNVSDLYLVKSTKR